MVIIYSCSKIVRFPAHPLDFNPIENLQEKLDKRIRKIEIFSKNKLKRESAKKKKWWKKF